MSKLLLLLIFFISVDGLAQSGDTMKKNQAENKLITGDSILKKLEKFKDSVLNTPTASDSIQVKEDMGRNITGLLALQKKQRVKEKRGAMIRIGIGVALLIVLIIGLRRKSAKK